MRESGFSILAEDELKVALDGLSEHLIERSEIALSRMPSQGKKGEPETDYGMRCSSEHLAYQELVYAFITLLEMADILDAVEQGEKTVALVPGDVTN